MTELKIKFNPNKHRGYFICKRFNKICYIYKNAIEHKFGWLCEYCGQMTKLDLYYHEGKCDGKEI